MDRFDINNPVPEPSGRFVKYEDFEKWQEVHMDSIFRLNKFRHVACELFPSLANDYNRIMTEDD
jgi:hypothetical protein